MPLTRRLFLLVAALPVLLLAVPSAHAGYVSASRHQGDAYPYSPANVDGICPGGWGAGARSTGGTWWYVKCWKGRANTFPSGSSSSSSYYTTNRAYAAWGWQLNPGAVNFWCGGLRPGSQLLQFHVTRERSGATSHFMASCA